ncbi:MAG: bifunctional diaminohydroxyphosphoribosylaminopyrimidine deaminase/5-amino-6-(5-phosphoribosylamino)uracil reductase RibD [Acidobacteria bacterium]|nr:bifunctional diaminohydroxyphosphoribosylaminopyrimidine deaminase/5-amino-6-(5-phosphoribosylamino)uracil reductase RibD [Acidobacteriota bacterium]
MSLTPQDALHLTRALTLAQQAIGLASPNPTVGCVLTQHDTPIAEGAHLYNARDHAEIAALKQAAAAGRSTLGATAYVTLEPCSHQGRTGPCADALIAAGIARCVVATSDPNPLVSGSGIAKLRAANISVTLIDPTHPLAQQGRQLNDAFAHFIQHRRPFVTLKAALSVDGKLAPPPSTRTAATPHWLTGTAARADVQLLRHASDAILTGIGTVLADNPSLTDRTGLPRRRPLLRVILDTHLRTPLSYPDHLKSCHPSPHSEDPLLPTTLILCSDSLSTAPAGREAALRALNIEVVRIPTAPYGHLDLPAVLTHLADRNIISLLLEAGSTLNAAFLRTNLVDKLLIYYTEHELGRDALPFAANFDSPYALQQRLTQITRTPFPSDIPPNTEDIRITGYLHDPWAATP